jgi:anaerobic magnesium-protoporphyrin IX monomethyl ester cyclase
LRVQLIHPPLYVNPQALTALRPAPPLGLAYVTAALKRAGHACGVLDAVAEAPQQTVPEGRLLRLGLSNEDIIDRLDESADVYAVANMWTFSWPVVRGIIQQIHSRFPEKLIVCGGEHFTGLPVLSMQQAPIDYLVLGEGEETAVRLFAALEAQLRRVESFDPATLRGIAWRDGGEIVVNRRAPRVRAVDEIPWPAWEEFDLHAYDENNLVTGIHFGMTVPILATRGCPYQCTYCSSPQMWTTRWYARNPTDVVDEIAFYKEKYGATNFPLQDLTAIIRKDWVVSFCNDLIARRLNVTWQMPSGTRCEVVDDEVAALLRDSGGRSLCFAPESGSENTRRLIKKRMKTESLMRAVRAAVKAGLNTSALLVIGFPHDRLRDLIETAKLVVKLAWMGVEDIACAFFFPIPATELYDDLRARGRIRETDDFLLTPIFVHDKYLTRERNYCEHISPAMMTGVKHVIVASFYAIHYVTHPRSIARRISNLMHGREESKMDTFLSETARKLRRRFSSQSPFGSRGNP